jgi:PPM family protein phosphatase
MPDMIASINKSSSVSYGMSDTGKVRLNNEDYFYFNDVIGLYIVTDGMGGHNSGELASEEAVLSLKNSLSSFDNINEAADLKSFVHEKILEAHNRILTLANENPEHRGMGCTLVMMFKLKNQLHIWHVGDARAYLINKNNISQLGTDHSFVSEMVKKGMMTKEEARGSEFKNKITMALGANVVIVPEYVTAILEKNDRVILCSDGLWDMLDDDEIREIAVVGNSAKKITISLYQEAMRKGGKDNITIITYRN